MTCHLRPFAYHYIGQKNPQNYPQHPAWRELINFNIMQIKKAKDIIEKIINHVTMHEKEKQMQKDKSSTSKNEIHCSKLQHQPFNAKQIECTCMCRRAKDNWSQRYSHHTNYTTKRHLLHLLINICSATYSSAIQAWTYNLGV